MISKLSGISGSGFDFSKLQIILYIYIKRTIWTHKEKYSENLTIVHAALKLF